jgi:hypothetical protein
MEARVKPAYPINELFAWVVEDPTGEHGIIGVMSPINGLPMQAVSSRKEKMLRPEYQEIVAQIRKDTGKPVELRRYVLAEVVKTDG